MNIRNLALAISVAFAPALSAQAATLGFTSCTSTTGVTLYTNIPGGCGTTSTAPSTSTTTTAPKPTTSTSTTTPTSSTSTTTKPTTTTSGLMTDAVFAANSFWYTPIPTNVPLHPLTSYYQKDFLNQKNTYYKTVNINISEYTSPVYIADSKTPRARVNEWDCQKKGWRDSGLLTQWASVPIPANALASPGNDKEMTVYSPSTNELWEFWQARKTSTGQWEACWGGKVDNAKLSDGSFPKYYGTTATSLAFIGGQITAEELQRGEIKHAIGISLVEQEHFTIFSYPAHRSDGWNPNKLPYKIPEGARFRLDPSINVDALNMPRAGKIIAKAAQKYGFVVWDKAGAISIRAQHVLTYTSVGKPNPYPAVFENKPNYEILKNFPWDRLQFLPMNYGKPSDYKL